MKPPPSYHVSSTKLGRLVNNNQNLYEVFGCFTLLLFTCSQFWFKFLFVPLPTNRRLLQAQQTASSDHPTAHKWLRLQIFQQTEGVKLKCCLLLLLGKKERQTATDLSMPKWALGSNHVLPAIRCSMRWGDLCWKISKQSEDNIDVHLQIKSTSTSTRFSACYASTFVTSPIQKIFKTSRSDDFPHPKI